MADTQGQSLLNVLRFSWKYELQAVVYTEIIILYLHINCPHELDCLFRTPYTETTEPCACDLESVTH
jgi:hypothetical protein